MTPDLATITVRGTGSVSVPPDRTVVTFNISALDKDYGSSADNLNERVAGLRERLTKRGIDGALLKTTQYTITPEHETRGTGENRRSVFMGWRAQHKMRLELPVDREKLNQAFEAITTEELDASLSVGFEVSDRNALRTMVLEDATRNACKNADAIARAAGCTLGKALKVDYSWAEIRYHGMAYEATADLMMAERAAPDIEPDDVEAEDSVTIVFELKA